MFLLENLENFTLTRDITIILEAQKEVVRANKLESCYIRPIVFYGSEAMGIAATNISVHVAIAAWPWGAYLGEEGMAKGIRVKTSSFTRHHVNINMCRSKSVGTYTNSILAHQEVANDGYDEALLLDVDGVLTDGTIIYTENGGEIKAFHTRDGMGLRLLRETGVEIGLITARQSAAVTRRAQDLGLTHVYQKAGNKLAIFERLLAELGLAPAEVAYLGDDWLDLPLITRVGLAAAVADAAPEVRQRAHYVTELPGGRGAVRELCDLLIEAKGMRQSLLARYIAGNGNK